MWHKNPIHPSTPVQTVGEISFPSDFPWDKSIQAAKYSISPCPPPPVPVASDVFSIAYCLTNHLGATECYPGVARVAGQASPISPGCAGCLALVLLLTLLTQWANDSLAWGKLQWNNEDLLWHGNCALRNAIYYFSAIFTTGSPNCLGLCLGLGWIINSGIALPYLSFFMSRLLLRISGSGRPIATSKASPSDMMSKLGGK